MLVSRRHSLEWPRARVVPQKQDEPPGSPAYRIVKAGIINSCDERFDIGIQVQRWNK